MSSMADRVASGPTQAPEPLSAKVLQNTMRMALAVLLVVHAFVHVAGFVKAFQLAHLPQFAPIGRPMGVVWLVAALLLLTAAALLFATPKWFWLVAGAALVLSQVAIATSWHDARFGTVLNVVVLLGVVYGAAAWGPFGLRAEYGRRTSRRLATLKPASIPVTEAELAPLPVPVQRYLRFAGVVGQPHVKGFRTRFSGRIRGGPQAPWMPFVGEQHNFFQPPARFFSMQAKMKGLPVEALHVYDAAAASMRVRVLSLLPMVDASGVAFTRGETVTLFNDMCIMAPSTLVDPKIQWRPIDAVSVEATYSNGPHTIDAVLLFDASGALVNFRSDDRPSLSADNVTFVEQRWSTPIGGYRAQGPFRLASRGEARYAAPSGEYAYIEFDGIEVTYDFESGFE